MTSEDAQEEALEREEDRITRGVGFLERLMILWSGFTGTVGKLARWMGRGKRP
jgi:hypothetical protein